MSWELKATDEGPVLVLDRVTGILDAQAFYEAVRPLPGAGDRVRVDARSVTAIHLSILQILHALSRAVPDFAVVGASEEFCAAEKRAGLALPRPSSVPTTPFHEVHHG